MFSQFMFWFLSLPEIVQISFLFVQMFFLFIGGILLFRYLRNKDLEITYGNVFLLQGFFLLPIVIIGIAYNNWMYLVVYILIGFIGMAAESFYSYYWHSYYRKPLWEYNFGAILNRYTSVVNFLAWSVGLMVFLSTLLILTQGQIPEGYMDFSFIFLSGTIVSHVIYLILIRGLTKLELIGKVDDGKLSNYLYISIPIVIPLIFASISIGWIYAMYTIMFGIAAFITEYLYGKGLKVVFGKKFWLYNYVSLDSGHTSPYNIGGAMVGGVLFTYVFLLIVG